MNGNRKATHTHTHTHHSISRASKFVESCCQATNLSNSICAQTSHWFIMKRKLLNQNQIFTDFWQLEHFRAELISIFGGKQKIRNQSEPLENSSTALEELAHYLWRFPSKYTQSTIASSAAISKLQLKHLPVIHTRRQTGRQSDRQVYILYRCLSVEHDDNDLASQWECECECEWMAGPKTADSRVPIWV